MVGSVREQDLSYVRRKVLAAWILFVALLGVVFWRLWQLQVERGAYFYQQAQAEAQVPLILPAPRGKILDRNGIVLAEDVPSFAATLSYTPQTPSVAEIDLLAKILGLKPATIAQAAQTLRLGQPFAPVVLRAGLTPAQYTAIAEQTPQLPGVSVVAEPSRVYPGLPNDPDPGQTLAANILGYVRAGKVPGDVRGASGVEESYNLLTLPGGRHVGLQGTDGQAVVEVDPRDHPLRNLQVTPPQPGDNVVLTINAKLQAVAQHALNAQLAALRTRTFGSDGGPFPQANAGAVVVLDPRTGQVLADVSEPTLDPNAFAQDATALPGSATAKAFAAQFQAWLDAPNHPFIDRTISEPVAPGSTFKPITAIAALEAGVITPNQHLNCPPVINLGGGYQLRNWIYPLWGGNLDLTEAMARSCDTYFYQVGASTGIARIAAMAQEFGLGSLTGQRDLYGEDAGTVSSPQAASARHQIWTPAITMQSAIGQGFNAFNVLQMADYVAALANGGTLWRPYFVQRIDSPSGRVLWQQNPQVRRQIPLAPGVVAAIHQAMGAVTSMNPSWWADGIDSDFGTAYWTFYGFTAETQQYLGRAIDVAGKTGTAELGPGQTPDGWWICWAPVNNPEIVIVVRSDHSGEGFVGGAPVAREILDYYFGLDRAMWSAGQAGQIIPAIVQQYFGQSRHYPSWWGTPPQAPASSTSRVG